MELLHHIKNLPPLTTRLASIITITPQFQLLYLLLTNKDIPFFKNILNTIQNNSSNLSSIFIFAQFSFNIITLLYLIIFILFFRDKKRRIENMILNFQKIKPNLLLIISIHFNIIGMKNGYLLLYILGTLNIVYTLLQLIFIRTVSISYRFKQQNLLNQKNNRTFIWFMYIPILLLLNLFGIFYSSCIIIIRSLIQIYLNVYSYEDQILQFNRYFTSLILLSFAFIEVISHIIGFHFLQHQNLLIVMIIMCSIFYGSYSLAQTLTTYVQKYQFKKNSYYFKNFGNQSQKSTQQSIQINQKQLQKFLLSLRILVKMYLSKNKYQGLQKINKQTQIQEFDIYWSLYNQLIIDHKINCNDVTCICLTMKSRSKSNENISQLIFQQLLFKSLRKVISSKPSNLTKILIIEKYFYIQILQKPIKNYYELIKLKNNTKNRQQVLQLHSLINQTRSLFQNLFTTQKVQNQTLPINQLLQFQTNLKMFKFSFIQLSTQYKHFYDLFANSFVQIASLKQSTSKLSLIKKQFDQKLNSNMTKFSRNLQYLSFAYIYYKFFNQYSSNLIKIQKKIKNFVEMNNIQKIITNKHHIDVFDPTYGAIKIDLVFRIGQIQNITKNLCQLLGYKREEVEGEKVNKIMPHIFSRHHDKFLSHFIEKGSIIGLKKRQRIFYAKNSKRFIFPITVRLKIQYFSSQSFSANSLIKKTPTKSQFIILNNYGKIEQVSQKIYGLLFRKAFEGQISKAKRINLFKMLLSLNHFVKNSSQNDDRIYEGTITTTQSEQTLISYYKHLQLIGNKNYMKKSQNTSNSANTQQKSNRSNSQFSIGSHSSFRQTVQMKENSYDYQKCCNDMKQSLRDFFKLVNFREIKAYKLSYKIYDLVTSSFKCKVLEIVNIKQEISYKHIKKEISKQIIQIGQLYNIQQQILLKFKNYHQQRPSTIINSNQNLLGLSGILQKYDEQDNENQVSFDSLLGTKTKVSQPLMEIRSATSSYDQQSQKNLSKSTVISAFQLKTTINVNLEEALNFLMIMAALTLVIICIFSTTLKPDYQMLKKDNLIISNFKTNFEFRLAVQQLYHFYHPFNLQAPQFLVSKKHILTDSMKQQLSNSIRWISSQISDDLYFDDITLLHADTGFQQKRPILATLGQIYSMFLMTQEQGQHLSDNYQTIKTHLEQLQKQEAQIIIRKSQEFRIKIHVIVAIYSTILIALVITFVLINNQSSQKTLKIIDFLPYINLGQVKKNINFFQYFADHLKQTQEVKLDQIHFIQTQTVIKDPIAQKNEKQQKTEGSKSLKLLPQLFSKLQEKLIQKKNKEAKQQNNSKLVKVINQNSIGLRFKDCIFLFFLILICLMVIVETEFFFISAHDKFKAYLTLKQEAMFVQSIPSRLILVYFINTDKVIHFQDVVPFPQSFYDIIEDKQYQLRQELSRNSINDTDLAVNINRHFNQKICDLIDCKGQITAASDQDIYFLTYRFINAFHYLKLIRQQLIISDDPKINLVKWMNDGNVLDVLKGTQHILQLMKKNEEQITQLFTQQINEKANQLLFFSLTLIPLLILSLYIFRKKFLKFTHYKLGSVENVYRQFSWRILSQNRYAVNYFEAKLRNSKRN